MAMKLTMAGSFLLLAAAASAATAATSASMVESRQASFKQIGKANKAIQDELRSGDPSLATIRTNARQIATLGAKLESWFPKGSGKESGVETAALPQIWTKPAEFKSSAVKMRLASRQLRAAADSGDMAAVKSANGQLIGTCRGCHQTFRERD